MAANISLQHKFDFAYLYNFTHNSTTPNRYIATPYSNQSVLALTFDGCVAAVGTGISYYSRQDVYDRVLLWRVPLLALWATTTLPSFGIRTQIFTLVHLIGDPIDTIWSLIYKLDLAKRTTLWAQKNDGTPSSFTFTSERMVTADQGADAADLMEDEAATERTNLINQALREKNSLLSRYFHDVPALIITAYDEWGYGEQASMAMNYGFNADRWNGVQRTLLRKKCAKVAFLIASDRVSRFLPSVASGLVFLVQLFAGFWKTLDTLSDVYDGTNPVSAGLNRAPHNIAFGALFFWLPFVVLLTALVGGSQTSHMIPKLLEEFRRDFDKSHARPRTALAAAKSESDQAQLIVHTESVFSTLGRFEAVKFPDISSEMYKRWSCGGLPVWQVEKFADFIKESDGGPSHRSFAWLGMFLSFSIVAIPTGCAIAVSWLTPTEGFGCRGITQLSFLLMWVASVAIDWALFIFARTQNQSQHSHGKGKTGTSSRYLSIYWITFIKDFFFMAATITTLTWTALGIFNKCECWCKWPRSSGYISFLQDNFVFQLTKHRLELHFPIIVGCALLSQIVIFGFVWYHFRDGHRVLKQRDTDSVLKSMRLDLDQITNAT